MNITSTSLTLSENVVFQQLEQDTVLLDTDTEKYFTLDTLGTDIWLLLSEHVSPADILDQLIRKYDVDEATLTSDLSKFLQDLLNAQLVYAPG